MANKNTLKSYCKWKRSRNKMAVAKHDVVTGSHKEQDLMVVHLVDGVHLRDVAGQAVPERGNLHGFRARKISTINVFILRAFFI